MATQESRVSSSNSRIGKIIEVANKDIEYFVKEKVKEKLVEDAEFLLEKKKRQEEKKERIKRMEQEYETKRQIKLKALKDKQAKSSSLREQSKEEMSRKIKNKSDQFRKVVTKIINNNQQEIQRVLNMRRQLEDRIAIKSVTKTERNSKNFQIQSARTHSVRNQDENVEQKIAEISNKTRKAQMLHEQQNRLMVEKIKQKAKNIEQAKKKAHSLGIAEESQKLRSCFEKNQQIESMVSRSKTDHEKRLTQKRKSVKEKLDRCSENLKQISYREEEKIQELDSKFNKINEPRQWKDQRLERYKQKHQQNVRKIELEKEQRAEQILHRHQQIAQQHRVYKEQKDKLIQAVKHPN